MRGRNFHMSSNKFNSVVEGTFIELHYKASDIVTCQFAHEFYIFELKLLETPSQLLHVLFNITITAGPFLPQKIK